LIYRISGCVKDLEKTLKISFLKKLQAISKKNSGIHNLFSCDLEYFFFLFFDILVDWKKISRLLKAILPDFWVFLEMWRFFQKISYFHWHCRKTTNNVFLRQPNHSEVILGHNFPIFYENLCFVHFCYIF
jgi:hypothetical protein